MTILEKVIKAWTQGKEVVVMWHFSGKIQTSQGKVIEFDTRDDGQIFLIGEYWHGRIEYNRIAELRFLDED